MIIGHGNLSDYYNTARFMKKYGGYSMEELENMYPFEFEIFYYIIIKELKEEAESLKNG